MQMIETLEQNIRSCTLCEDVLPCGPNPVIQFSEHSKILIAGQAPGRKVHYSGIPFNDASGRRLREWLGLSEDQFYDAKKIAIVPMGFCYPGSGTSGDLAPRPECAKTWRNEVIGLLEHIQFTVVLGRYALAYHLPSATGTLSECILNWRSHQNNSIPLPHPSPRNNIWLKKNPWFESEIIPIVKAKVEATLTK